MKLEETRENSRQGICRIVDESLSRYVAMYQGVQRCNPCPTPAQGLASAIYGRFTNQVKKVYWMDQIVLVSFKLKWLNEVVSAPKKRKMKSIPQAIKRDICVSLQLCKKKFICVFEICCETNGEQSYQLLITKNQLQVFIITLLSCSAWLYFFRLIFLFK